MYSKSLSFKSSSDIQVIRDIDDILCRGYRPSENDIKQFKQRGINTIIDFSFETFKDSSPDTEKKLAEKYGIKYYNIPFLDTTNPEDDKIEKFFSIIENVKKDNGKIFIHCLHGKNRTGLMCEIYKLKNRISTYDESLYNLMKSKYPFGENPMANTLLKKMAYK